MCSMRAMSSCSGAAEMCLARLPEDDNFVSRVQFLLDVNPPRVMIRDAGSNNGTLLNGRWIGGRRIPPGSMPWLGGSTRSTTATRSSWG